MANSSGRNTTTKYWQANRERVAGLNKRAATAIKKKLSRIPLLEEQICISAIGSDGRLEKGLDSKLEVQMLHKGLTPSAIREIDMMVREIELNGQPLLNGSETEAKEVGKDTMVYAFSNRSVPAPARILDSLVLFGNPALAAEAKAELVAELAGKPGRRALEKLKERKRTSKSITETGTQTWRGKEYSHFDLEGGVAYFTDVEDGNGGSIALRGFKHGPLRYVQGVIEQNLASFVRSMLAKGDSAGARIVLNELPTPTTEKLEYLQDVGVSTVSPEGICEACDCYLRFLQLYHMAEWMAAKGRSEMRFEAKEAMARIQTLTRVLEGGIVQSV